MTDEVEDGPTRQSSPRFPFIALPKALQRAQELREAAGNGFTAVEQVREIWGYGPKSSGGDQTIAALGYYGLLEEGAANNGRRLKLTDLAVRYLREERDEERQRLAADMVAKPKAMQTLWGLWQREIPPSVSVARSVLKNDLHFSDSAANQVLEVYRSNLQYFPGSTSDKVPEQGKGVQELSDDKPQSPQVFKVGDWVQWTSGGVDRFATPKKVSWINADDGFLRVEGSMTGLPISEVSHAAAPAIKADAFVLQPPPPGELQMLLTGGRLQITADVDLDGLRRLKTMLAKYEEILELMKLS